MTPRAESSAAPLPTAAPKPLEREGSLEEYCSQGLTPSGSIERDVHRLGVLCGPTTGLQPLASVATRSLAETGSLASYRPEAGECVRAIAASSSDEVIDLEWKSQDGVLAHCRLDHMGLCPTEGALCPPARHASSGPLELELWLASPLETQVAVALWRRRKH